MKHLLSTILLLTIIGNPYAQKLDSNWVDLFNGTNFDGWYSYIKNSAFDDPKNDPKEHFKILEDQGSKIIDYQALTGTSPGFLSTDSAYSRYHFRVEYRLGTKCILNNYCKNSGLLYAMIQDGIWGLGIESNMYFEWPSAFSPLGKGGNRVKVDAVRPNFNSFQKEAEKMGKYAPVGEWNRMEVIVWGADSAKQIINGLLGGWGKGIKKPDGSPLTRGRIALQIEGNDVSFRNPQIRNIDKAADTLGCTDSLASNFNPSATKNDGSCITTSIQASQSLFNFVTYNKQESSLHFSIEDSHENYLFKLTDVQGKIFWNYSGSDRQSFDLTLPQGIYFMHYSRKGFSDIQKINVF